MLLINGLKRKKVLLFGAYLVFSVFSLTAQNRFPGDSGSRQEFAVEVSMDNISFNDVALIGGFVVEDFLFLGVDLRMDFDEIESLPAQNLQLGISARAAVLQQDDLFPLSCTLFGTFRKDKVIGDYLTDNELIKSGTGFSVGTDLFRDFVLNPDMALRIGLTASYRSQSFTTEPETGPTAYEDRVFEDVTGFGGGLIAGITFRINERMLLSVDLKGGINNDLHVIYGPSISISSIGKGPSDQ
ncbi:MAG: hypothetical protein JXR86_02930 [Spirochaetales bacterium]|nr:hypothetical protein [Spirochaetales bacterium]